MDGVYDILDFMTNEPDITTCGLLLVNDKCGNHLLERYPELDKANTSHAQEKLDELLENENSLFNAINKWLDWVVNPEGCNLQFQYKVYKIAKK